MYYYGKGVNKDLNKSMEWYMRVAETGDTDAMIKIGNMYDCGEGVSKSQKKQQNGTLVPLNTEIPKPCSILQKCIAKEKV